MNIPTKPLELMLAGWRESNTSGFVVSFFVLPEDEHYFREAKARTGKAAGQRYQTVFVQLVDGQEVPDPESVKPLPIKITLDPAFTKPSAPKAHFPLGLCGLAVKWCADDHFRLWLAEELGRDGDASLVPETLTADWAKGIICDQCGIESRAQLDNDAVAADLFRKMIMEPYIAVRKEDGVDG